MHKSFLLPLKFTNKKNACRFRIGIKYSWDCFDQSQ